MPARRQQIEIARAATSAEEAAAITAAIQRFLLATALPPPTGPEPASPWVHAALMEGVERDPAHVGGI